MPIVRVTRVTLYWRRASFIVPRVQDRGTHRIDEQQRGTERFFSLFFVRRMRFVLGSMFLLVFFPFALLLQFLFLFFFFLFIDVPL